MIYSVDEIRDLHLEISSKCNAACPLCTRNLYGYPYNDGYVEHDMTLEEAQKIFTPNFVAQLDRIYLNGNFGDAVMNPHTVDIIRYFRNNNPDAIIQVSTNGGARTDEFWYGLATLCTEVIFCLDGVDKWTHQKYRQNTMYSTVLKNANTVIKSGGNAVWKFIVFDHNEHQLEEAHQLSIDLGFSRFQAHRDGRTTGPVFNNNGDLVHVMGRVSNTDFKSILEARKTNTVLVEDIIHGKQVSPINCQVKRELSVYVDSQGNVYPCCFLGFSPKTYGHGWYYQAANGQFKDMVVENNALEYDFAHCIEWFNSIEKTWDIPSFEQGRLVICNDICGKKS